MGHGHSFTVTAQGGLLRSIVSDCYVCVGLIPMGSTGAPPLRKYKAIWDTGATGTVITQKIVDECGLQPTGIMLVNGVNGQHQTNSYVVSIGLPNGVGIQDVEVTRGNLGDSCDVLIGMDIITMGDLSITNKDGITIFSFRVPSQASTDFVKQHTPMLNARPLVSQNKTKKRPKQGKKFGKNK